MEINEIWEISKEITTNLLHEMPPIEELYPSIKNEKFLTYIKQDEKSTVEYNKILDNYEDNFKRIIKKILLTKYRIMIEKGKEFTPVILKKVVGSVKRITKERINNRFSNLQKRAKNSVILNNFIKEKEEEINDTLIDTTTAKKLLCLTNHEVLATVKKSVRAFMFAYEGGATRYYFSKSDITNLANKEKDQMPARQRAKKIREIKKVINRIMAEMNFYSNVYPDYDCREAMEKIEYQEKLIEELKKQKK